ncbi:hypothetical protein [Catenovulum maritimum]|uniref:DUF2846 domain-containing protein n=1 Tax=Catenovulum maritimum TaxID=1513271 RepID=A0A0J8GZT4_9ALTE|nr:hypothetical protein [Catenovulum maritimum]KMT66744.1 hypothetical protein XM47_01055 [Catenovulum maritimum]
MKNLFIAIFLLTLVSCAGVREIENYQNLKSNELPALIIASRHFSPYGTSLITRVDDKKKTLTNSTHGGNMAVRVSPGTHLIDIAYANHGSGTKYSTAIIENISIDTKSGHVYEAQYTVKTLDTNQFIEVTFKDLGFNKLLVLQKVIE